METVTVSRKFQVVIPRAVRESLDIKPGQRLDGFEHDGRIELVPVRHPREMRGFLARIDTTVERDPDRV
jgi:AbrB family looped-hinge helix DNA binding protein